jgi:hypothetical protein
VNISGWEIDLPAVYGASWEKRERFHLTEKLYESPDGRWAVMLFGLGEVRMNKQVGALALFREKTAPVLVYHSGSTTFWYEGIAGEPVVFSPDGRGARVVEFLQTNPKEFGSRERALNFDAGDLVPLPTQPSSLRERWKSLSSRHKVVGFLVSVLLAAGAVVPFFLFAGIVLEHRRDAQMIDRGRELHGRVMEFSGSSSDFDWSRVRVETGPGSTTDYVIHERLPAGRDVTLLQDPLTGEVRGKDDVARGLSYWPWNLLVWLVFLSPLYLGIPWMFRRLGRKPARAP